MYSVVEDVLKSWRNWRQNSFDFKKEKPVYLNLKAELSFLKHHHSKEIYDKVQTWTRAVDELNQKFEEDFDKCEKKENIYLGLSFTFLVLFFTGIVGTAALVKAGYTKAVFGTTLCTIVSLILCRVFDKKNDTWTEKKYRLDLNMKIALQNCEVCTLYYEYILLRMKHLQNLIEIESKEKKNGKGNVREPNQKDVRRKTKRTRKGKAKSV